MFRGKIKCGSKFICEITVKKSADSSKAKCLRHAISVPYSTKTKVPITGIEGCEKIWDCRNIFHPSKSRLRIDEFIAPLEVLK